MKLSVIIPSRQPEFLQKTINDLLTKAQGDIEIIVVLDGQWPNPMITDHPKVRVIHHGSVHNSRGMRESINMGVAISTGEYIMKCDEHCLFSPGFDTRMISICKDDWVIVPRRYRLDAVNWKIIEDGRPPIDYMRIDYPYQRPLDKTCGLHGGEDKERHFARKDIEVDDLMTMQGSCYFMSRKHWDNVVKEMSTERYGPFTMEAQEISMPTWLSGGRVVVDKGCYYAHYHKGSGGKGYGFSTEQYKKHAEGTERGRLYAIEYWMHTKDYKYDFEWLIKKFWPIRGWADTWKEDVIRDKKTDYSTLKYENDFWLSNIKGQNIDLGLDKVNNINKKTMKNRQELAKYFAELGFKVGAEIGVCKGYYSLTLCSENPGLTTLYGIDNWSNNSGTHRERNHRDSAYRQTLERLAPFIEKGVYKIIRKSSMEALADISDGSLDFVYIDADHSYKAVKEDVEGWAPKVRDGGIVSGHDFYTFKSGAGGIIPAVNEYIAKTGYTLQLTEWDNSNPDGDSRQPSWFFIKEVK